MVDRNVIFFILEHFKHPEKIIRIINNIYTRTEAQVVDNGQLSAPFAINTGVR